MPSSILSHNFPGLLLKIKYPSKIDGTALIFGTFVPDLNFIVDLFLPVELRNLTHSLLGLFIWTIPLSLLFTFLFSRYFSSYFVRIARIESKLFQPMRYFGIDQWDYLKNKNYNRRSLILMSYSSLIGGITHLILDLPSHRYIQLFFPFIILQNPDFLLIQIFDFSSIGLNSFNINSAFTIYGLIWQLESIIGAIIFLHYLRYIAKNNLYNKWNLVGNQENGNTYE